MQRPTRSEPDVLWLQLGESMCLCWVHRNNHALRATGPSGSGHLPGQRRHLQLRGLGLHRRRGGQWRNGASALRMSARLSQLRRRILYRFGMLLRPDQRSLRLLCGRCGVHRSLGRGGFVPIRCSVQSIRARSSPRWLPRHACRCVHRQRSGSKARCERFRLAISPSQVRVLDDRGDDTHGRLAAATQRS